MKKEVKMEINIFKKKSLILLIGIFIAIFICINLVSADSNKTSIIYGVGGPIAKVGPDGTSYFIGSDMSDMMIVSNTGKKEYEVIYDDSGNIIREVNKLPEDLNPLVDPNTGLGPDGKDPFVGLRAYLRSGEVCEAFSEPLRFAYLFKDAATSDAIAAGAWCKDFVLHPSKHMIHESVSNFYFSTLPAIAEIGPKGIAIGIGGGIVNGLDNYFDDPTAANAKIAWGATKYYFVSKALIAGSELISPPSVGFYGDDIVYGVAKNIVLPAEITRSPALAKAFSESKGVVYLPKKGAKKLNILLFKRGTFWRSDLEFALEASGLPVKQRIVEATTTKGVQEIIYGQRGWWRTSSKALLQKEVSGPPYRHSHLRVAANIIDPKIHKGYIDVHLFTAPEISHTLTGKFKPLELDMFINEYPYAIFPTGEIVSTEQLFKEIGLIK